MRADGAAQPRILIVGAGPAGLSTAYYLKKNGYRNVLVLEKLGRVGGLAESVTVSGHSYDLGANYVTPAYREILAMAKEMGAETYTERPFVAMTVPKDTSQPVSYRSIFDALRVDKSGKTIPLPTFFFALLKFVWLRHRIAGIIDRPTMAGLEGHPELCVPFGEWLANHGIDCLTTVFELPITLMGYGYINQTAAPYALKFMTLRSFIPMVLKEAPIIGPWLPWPRRFTLGFQRLWEKISWSVDVRLNANIKQIDRADGRIHVAVDFQEQVLNRIKSTQQTIQADYLILACPLSPDVIGQFLSLSREEDQLFRNIITFSYCMTTFQVEGLHVGDGVSGAGPLAAVFPLAPMGEPWGVAKQWDDSDFVQFYTRVDPTHAHEAVRGRVLERIRTLVKQMGGTIVQRNQDWETYTRWPYFQHVEPAVIASGFYTDLENLQGQQKTFYVGGATNFELIEPIAEYAKHLVARHFPPRR